MNTPAHANDNAARPPEEPQLTHLDRMQEAVHNAYQERPTPVRAQVDAVMCQVSDWASIAAKDARLYHVADSPKANAALNQLAGELELNAMRIGEALLAEADVRSDAGCYQYVSEAEFKPATAEQELDFAHSLLVQAQNALRRAKNALPPQTPEPPMMAIQFALADAKKTAGSVQRAYIEATRQTE